MRQLETSILRWSPTPCIRRPSSLCAAETTITCRGTSYNRSSRWALCLSSAGCQRDSSRSLAWMRTFQFLSESYHRSISKSSQERISKDANLSTHPHRVSLAYLLRTTVFLLPCNRWGRICSSRCRRGRLFCTPSRTNKTRTKADQRRLKGRRPISIACRCIHPPESGCKEWVRLLSPDHQPDSARWNKSPAGRSHLGSCSPTLPPWLIQTQW